MLIDQSGVIKGVAAAVYTALQYLDERRAALQAWGGCTADERRAGWRGEARDLKIRVESGMRWQENLQWRNGRAVRSMEKGFDCRSATIFELAAETAVLDWRDRLKPEPAPAPTL